MIIIVTAVIERISFLVAVTIVMVVLNKVFSCLKFEARQETLQLGVRATLRSFWLICLCPNVNVNVCFTSS